jgi:hypothetical protein
MSTTTPIPTPSKPVHFNYPHAAASAGLSSIQLLQMVRIFEADYPYDLMLRELHILRACNAIARGFTTLEAILSPVKDAA